MKVLKNYLYNLTFQLLLIILPIITTPYISRVLKVDGVGKYSVAYAVCNYFVLFGMLGFSSYGSREIAYVRDNDDERIRTFWEINNVKFTTMGLSSFVYFIYVIFFVQQDLKALYFVQVFTLFSSLADISWYFSGMENFKKTATRNIFVKVISVILIFAFVKSKEDLVLYALIIAGSTFCGQVVLWKDIDVKKEFSWKKSRPGKTLYHLKRTMGLWFPALAINVFTYLDKIMLGYISGDTQVGLYESSDKINRMAIIAVTAFATVMVPKMSNLFAKQDLNEFNRLIDKSLSFVLVLSIPMTFGIIGISQTVVPWFLGEGYEPTSNLLLISSWLAIALGLSSVFGNQVLISLNSEKKYTIAVSTAAIIDISLNIILIPKFNAYGAILASVIANYVCMLMMMFYARKYFSTRAFVKKLAFYSIVSAVMGLLVWMIGIPLQPTIITTALQIVVGGLFYVCVLFVFKDENILVVGDLIKKRNNHK